MEEATLIRFIDGQVSAPERASIALHVARCPECGEQLTRLERISRALHSLLGLAEPVVAVPPFETVERRRSTRHRRESLRLTRTWRTYALAAGIALVLLLAAAPPVRALIGSVLSRLRGAEPAAPAAAPTAPAEPEFTHSLVEFRPSGSQLTADFQRPEAGALLLVGAHEEATAVLLTTGSGEDDVTVLPSGIRVTGLTNRRRDYRLTVPASMGSVVVRVAGRPVLVSTGADLRGVERRVEFTPP